jgi:hypothetical protein
MNGETGFPKAGRNNFAPPGTSANCVIARLHPQLSHLAETGYKANPMAAPNIYSTPWSFSFLQPPDSND